MVVGRDGVTRDGDTVRVLGVDPGLTRCGLGVVEGVPGRPPVLVGAGVVGTPAGADIAARTLMAPAEIPVGAVTAAIGAPLFVYLLKRT